MMQLCHESSGAGRANSVWDINVYTTNYTHTLWERKDFICAADTLETKKATVDQYTEYDVNIHSVSRWSLSLLLPYSETCFYGSEHTQHTFWRASSDHQMCQTDRRRSKGTTDGLEERTGRRCSSWASEDGWRRSWCSVRKGVDICWVQSEF